VWRRETLRLSLAGNRQVARHHAAIRETQGFDSRGTNAIIDFND
jgi:hypothetical protein